MYTLRVRRTFVAQHYLTTPNAGPENEWHSHQFDLEVILKGPSLNEDGYLLDIVELKSIMDTLVDRYTDATLNDLPEFDNLNPSIEHFARICCDYINNNIEKDNINSTTVRIWEDDEAWASYCR